MFSVFIIISSVVCHCGLTHPLENTVSQLKTDSNYGQKRAIIGWAHHNGQKRIELHWKDDTQPRISGDIKQIVIAWSVVNIKISFVVQSASVSCSLSESQQHFVSDFKTEMPPTINLSWKDFRWVAWQNSPPLLSPTGFSHMSYQSVVLLTSDIAYIP